MVFVSDASGRFITSYVPECLVNESMKKQAGITDNYNYKLYLQRNAVKIMEANRKQLSVELPKSTCTGCKNCTL